MIIVRISSVIFIDINFDLICFNLTSSGIKLRHNGLNENYCFVQNFLSDDFIRILYKETNNDQKI